MSILGEAYPALRRDSGLTEVAQSRLGLESLLFPRWYLAPDDWQRLSEALADRAALPDLARVDMVQLYSSEAEYSGQDLWQSSLAVSVFYYDASETQHHRFFRLRDGAAAEDDRLYDTIDGGISCDTAVALQQAAHGQIPPRSLVYSLLSQEAPHTTTGHFDDDLRWQAEQTLPR